MPKIPPRPPDTEVVSEENNPVIQQPVDRAEEAREAQAREAQAHIDNSKASKSGKDKRDAQSEAIPTATLAELYVRQGLIDRAIAVYLTLMEHDPTNPDINKRLSELFVTKSQRGRS